MVLDQVLYAGSLLLAVGSVSLGLFIGYHAYRGFRRHESGPMRYLSIGLILLTAVASTFALLSWALSELDVIPAVLDAPLYFVYRAFQFAGLCFIAYSLYRRP